MRDKTRQREGSTWRSPPPLGYLLRRLDRSRIDPFLTLREALLALPGVEERILRAGADWVPAFYLGEQELVRIRLVTQGQDGVRAILSVPPEAGPKLAHLRETRPATRKRLEALLGERRGGSLPLSLADDDDLAEVVSLALALHGRIGGGR